MRILIIVLPALFLSATTPALAKIAVMHGRLPGQSNASDFLGLQQSPDRATPIQPSGRDLLPDQWDGYAASVFHPEGPANMVN